MKKLKILIADLGSGNNLNWSEYKGKRCKITI